MKLVDKPGSRKLEGKRIVVCDDEIYGEGPWVDSLTVRRSGKVCAWHPIDAGAIVHVWYLAPPMVEIPKPKRGEEER